MITFGSLFAGIGGFDLGFERAGMACRWQVENDPAAASVLARHYPNVPRYADIRDCSARNLTAVNVICGGFPCQDLSIAGKRGGLAGQRSGLFYEMIRIIHELQPNVLVWENVPGLLSSRRGNDFAHVLMALDRIGYSGCWSTVDAQFFGVAQRRRRVFGCFARANIGTRRCTEILSFIARMPRHPETGSKTRADVAARVTARVGHHGWASPGEDGTNTLIARPLTTGTGQRYDFETDDLIVAATIQRGGNNGGFRTEPGAHLVAVPLLEVGKRTNGDGRRDGDGIGANGDPMLCSGLQRIHGIARRLTPRECERLQGFPDDWTAGQSDSARYKQCGNAVAVPCAEWIGRGIVKALHEVDQ
jgi:DNA (cytosine-5)-methyltransferase 1